MLRCWCSSVDRQPLQKGNIRASALKLTGDVNSQRPVKLGGNNLSNLHKLLGVNSKGASG